ncbi:shufflon system plasmid conjugative transfer pilus tip adhesin PilV [Neopusillimonas maritima]|uniref:Bacterial shufflon protein N-terminal domain-containing protein n=1 Tax=Neopusillimonas maritima TaxID=2026239 RepID=A0A3A1YVY5_9BURK|nr:shufflon system plasmid conjugative transfer pilus tip adhesin PilV [Neopusillimonas maritima]RIY41010.1 hypothetical protein CJP73_07640 [Neopusillimonas maritima]
MMKINKIKSYISLQLARLNKQILTDKNNRQDDLPRSVRSKREKLNFARKAGITGIEMAVVLVLLAVGATYGVTHYTQFINHQVTQSAADHLQMLTEAVSNYTLDNRAALATTASTSPGYITSISETDLRSGGYLRSNESLTNPLGQTYQVLVKGSATSATDQKIMPFIVSDGNDTLAEPGDARRVANAIGGTAGFTTAEEPETIRGTNNLWEFDVAQWGLSAAPERIASAVFYDDGVGQMDLSALLHRNYDPANPALNRMNTAIDMNGNNVTGANQFSGVSANLSSALTVGAGGINSTGNVASSGQVSGNTVVANAIASNGSISAAGNVTASSMYTSNWFRTYGATGWYSQTYGGGWHMSDSTWIRAYGGKSIYTPGTIQGGYIQGNAIRSIQYAPPGGGCSGGSIGYYGGYTMSCANGVWRYGASAAAFGGSYMSFMQGGRWYCTYSNPATGGCSCPAGYSAINVFSGGDPTWGTNYSYVCQG